MTDRQEDFITMCNTVLVGMERHIALITPRTAVNNAYLAYKQHCIKLNAISLEQLLQTKGEAINKNNLRLKLALEMSIITKLVKNYAADKEKPVLYNAVNYPESSFKTMRDETLQHVAQILQATIDANAADLADYEVTPAIIDDFTVAWTKYQAVITNPTQAIVKKKGATAELKAKITEVSGFFDTRLDNVMQIYRKPEPTFFRYYTNTRVIRDLRGKKAKTGGFLAGVLKSATTDELLASALVEVLNTDFVTTANGLGEYKLPLPAGTYSVRITVDGYTEFQQDDVVITKGQTTTLDAALEAMV